ncbi:hypothetical protein CRYUN_Cryun21dG0065500 [Craigia yunnanensis]
MMPEQQKIEVETQVAIHGDVLETIFSHIPLIHLLPASTVSNSWNAAVFSSLRCFNKPKPWLFVHTQSIHAPHATTAFAYDPRSSIWLKIHQKLPTRHVSALRSSDSKLLYALTPSKFSFSIDRFRLTWHHANPPAVWRTDPVVAVVGNRIIVAGGACDFEDDPLAVELYDINAHVGVTHSFNPNSKIWSGPYELRPDRSIYCSVIGFHGDNLIMVGLLGDSENVNGVKVWELNRESFEYSKEIGVMPKELVEKLKGEGTSFSSIRVSSVADFFYIYNPGEPGELVVLEVGGEGLCRWGSLRNAAVNDCSRVADRVLLTCSDVGLGDLGRALGSGNGIFTY